MARFERSRAGRGSSSGRGSGGGSRPRGAGGRSSGRDRRDVTMTKVICSSCGVECEVPFKPTSSKPVYCNNCFSKKDKDSSNKPSERDFDVINEKLNKIMAALHIK
ncbi:MAG: hypothetical protein GY861_19455 [bacterium]|nr:hypothetical protein [bacterium]